MTASKTFENQEGLILTYMNEEYKHGSILISGMDEAQGGKVNMN